MNEDISEARQWNFWPEMRWYFRYFISKETSCQRLTHSRRISYGWFGDFAAEGPASEKRKHHFQTCYR